MKGMHMHQYVPSFTPAAPWSVCWSSIHNEDHCLDVDSTCAKLGGKRTYTKNPASNHFPAACIKNQRGEYKEREIGTK